MLVRLMYASRPVPTVDQDELVAILRKSKANNPGLGITGVLCLCLNERIFMQVLEGGRTAVNRLYQRIATDPRHTDVELLSYEEIGERRFEQSVLRFRFDPRPGQTVRTRAYRRIRPFQHR